MADPAVFTIASLTGVEDEHPSLHAAYNDDLAIEVDTASLVGRTDDARGAAQAIGVSAPLVLAEQSLSLDAAVVISIEESAQAVGLLISAVLALANGDPVPAEIIAALTALQE